jgi:hypothetical protein
MLFEALGILTISEAVVAMTTKYEAVRAVAMIYEYRRAVATKPGALGTVTTKSVAL